MRTGGPAARLLAARVLLISEARIATKLAIVAREFVTSTSRPRTIGPGPAGPVVIQPGVSASNADAARAYVTIGGVAPVPLQGSHASRTTTAAQASASRPEACVWHQAVILDSTLMRTLKRAGAETTESVAGRAPHQR